MIIVSPRGMIIIVRERIFADVLVTNIKLGGGLCFAGVDREYNSRKFSKSIEARTIRSLSYICLVKGAYSSCMWL